MKKILLVALLILANSLLESCGPDDEACFQLEPTAIRNITLDDYRQLSAGDTTQANNYGLLLQANSMRETCSIHYAFGGSLLADVFYSLTDKVTEISISSNSALSANFPAGSELKSLFAPKEIASHCVDQPGASADCVYDYFSYPNVETLEQALNDEMATGFVERAAGLRLFALSTTEAISDRRHIFTVQLDFQSGRSVVLETEEIVFQ